MWFLPSCVNAKKSDRIASDREDDQRARPPRRDNRRCRKRGRQHARPMVIVVPARRSVMFVSR